MPSPQDVACAADVATSLSALREVQAKSIRAVSRETGIPSATLGGYFSGRHLPSTTQPGLLDRLLEALGVCEGERAGWHEAIRRVRRTPGPRPSRENPYRGLEPYGIDDADLFFGRDELTAMIREAVVAAGATDCRWVTLVGPSGGGKSSLLRAGVLAGLRASGRAVAVVRPSETSAEALRPVLEGLGDGVLGVDQLAELFSPCVSASQRQALLTLLTEAATRPGGGPTIVTAVRADRVGRCVDEPLLWPLRRQRQFLVSPIGDAALADVIAGPARARGRAVEPELETMIRRLAGRKDATGPVLPLLSHVLRVMWDRDEGPLTARDYMAVGCVGGALESSAESVWHDLDAPGRVATRRVFRQLATVDEAGRVAPRRVPMATLAGDAAIVEAFIAQRILVATSTDVEVSHEIVLSAWPRLRGWLAEDRDALRAVHRLGVAAASWVEHGRPPSDLLRGAALDIASRIAGPDHPAAVVLTEVEQEYLAESLADRARRHHRANLVRGSLTLLSSGVAALAVVSTVLAVHLHHSTRTAGIERVRADRALSRQVALEARDLEPRNVLLARRLALAAYRIRPTAQARSTLLESASLPVTSTIDPEQVAASICATVAAPISAEQWAEYVPGEAYADPCAAP